MNSTRPLMTLIMAAVWMSLSPFSLAQTTLHVATTGDDSGNNCQDPQDPCETIQFALNSATPGDIISIAAGEYVQGFEIQIEKDITIEGTSTQDTILQAHSDPGQAAHRVIRITTLPVNVTISNVTIRHGVASGAGEPGRGGGLYNPQDAGLLHLSDVTFSLNEARVGGGLFNGIGASVTMENVAFLNNSADERGGGIYNWDDSTMELDDSSFIENDAGIYGGGIFNFTGNLLDLETVSFTENHGDWGCGALAMNSSHPDTTFKNVVFSSNTAGGIGGAVCLDNSSPAFTDVDFENNKAQAINSAAHGGGMRAVSNSSPTLTNVTFSGNEADNRGGGMYNASGSSPELNNVNFIGNNATDEGGGMANIDFSSPALTNVVFQNNATLSSDDSRGGGMANLANSSPVLLSVEFSLNSAFHGGGMANLDNSAPTLMNVIFVDNETVAEAGGGMANWSSSPSLSNVLFHSNSAGFGGGIYNNVSFPLLTNVSFYGNQAGVFGGALYNIGTSAPIAYNSIFWGNSASSNGNEISNTSDSFSSLHFSLHSDEPGDIHDASGSNFTCSDCLTDDPLFLDAEGGDLRLDDGSPAIDAGDPTTDMSQFPGGPANPIDLEGNTRVFGAIIDIGAHEWRPDKIFNDRFKSLLQPVH